MAGDVDLAGGCRRDWRLAERIVEQDRARQGEFGGVGGGQRLRDSLPRRPFTAATAFW